MGVRRRETVDVESFDDYPALIRALFEAAKEAEPGFTLQRAADVAGYRSRQWLKSLMDGGKNLSARGVEAVAAVFGLTPSEEEHLRLLYVERHGPTEQARLDAARELGAREHVRRGARFGAEVTEYLSSWHLPAIREMALLRGFRARVDWVRARLLGDFTRAEVQHAIGRLLHHGLWRRRERGDVAYGDWYATGHEFPHDAGATYHRAMLQRAVEAIDTIASDARHINGLTVALPADRLPALKERVNAFIEQVEAEAQALAPDQPDTVYQLEVAIFPHTRPPA